MGYVIAGMVVDFGFFFLVLVEDLLVVVVLEKIKVGIFWKG